MVYLYRRANIQPLPVAGFRFVSVYETSLQKLFYYEQKCRYLLFCFINFDFGEVCYDLFWVMQVCCIFLHVLLFNIMQNFMASVGVTIR